MVLNCKKKPVLCCSYPKSGRSWLRFILANYLNCLYQFKDRIDYNNVFSILPNRGPDPLRGIPAYQYMIDERVPLVAFLHAEYQSNFDEFDVVFLIRGIHDTLVSGYFQAVSRLRVFHGDIKSFVRNDDIGVMNLIRYLNSWSDRLMGMKHTVVSYEGLHEDTQKQMVEVIAFLGMHYDAPALAKAIELSSFTNMKDIEIQHGFPNPHVRLDVGNNDALRAREGKVGNYLRYLDSEDVQHIDESCDRLLSVASKKLMRKSIPVPEPQTTPGSP